MVTQACTVDDKNCVVLRSCGSLLMFMLCRFRYVLCLWILRQLYVFYVFLYPSICDFAYVLSRAVLYSSNQKSKTDNNGTLSKIFLHIIVLFWVKSNSNSILSLFRTCWIVVEGICMLWVGLWQFASSIFDISNLNSVFKSVFYVSTYPNKYSCNFKNEIELTSSKTETKIVIKQTLLKD